MAVSYAPNFPRPRAAIDQGGGKQRAGMAKRQLFCRTLRRTVRQRCALSPNRKSTNGNNFSRLGTLASKSRRDAVGVVKTDNLTIQLEIQSIRGDRHLDNKGVPSFVGDCLTRVINQHFRSRQRGSAIFGYLSFDERTPWPANPARQGDSLKRSGMAHSDSYGTVKGTVRGAARPRRVSYARCILDSGLVSNWLCLALPKSDIGVGDAPIT